MKIYTRRGDRGQTSLVDGSKANKSDLRLDTYGTVDELNSHLGLLISGLKEVTAFNQDISNIQQIQIWLFQLGSQLACADPEMAKHLPTLTHAEQTTLEKQIDFWDDELPQLKNFVLPGGHPLAAQAHICRTVCRRAERHCVGLSKTTDLDDHSISFLNRLSDYLFCLARLINHRLGIDSIEWQA